MKTGLVCRVDILHKLKELLEIRKSLNESLRKDSKLEYFKREILEILNRQEVKEVIKSLDFIDYFYVEKANFGVGHVSTYKDGSMWRKTQNNPPGWKCIRPARNLSYSAESKNVRIAIGKLKKKIRECEDIGTLHAIMLANKDRFLDAYGKPLPIVKEIQEEFKKQKVNFRVKGQMLSRDDKKIQGEFAKTEKVAKNEKGQFIYNDYKELTEAQQKYVMNDLLNREYKEIDNGIFAEKNREKDIGEEKFSKEFMDCQILRQIGFDKLYMLPQQYAVRENKKTATNTDTIAFDNNGVKDFIELKTPDNSTIDNLKAHYKKSLKQARNVFIYYGAEITDDAIITAIDRQIKGIQSDHKTNNLPEVDFTGTVFVCKAKDNEVLRIDVKSNGLELPSSPEVGTSSQILSKRGSCSTIRFSLNNISPNGGVVKKAFIHNGRLYIHNSWLEKILNSNGNYNTSNIKIAAAVAVNSTGLRSMNSAKATNPFHANGNSTAGIQKEAPSTSSNISPNGGVVKKAFIRSGRLYIHKSWLEKIKEGLK